MESRLLQTDPSCANWSLGSFPSMASHCLLTLQRSLLLSTHHWRKAGPWRLEGKGSKCVQVCAFARVHVGRCILEGPCGHNLICWCRGAGGDTCGWVLGEGARMSWGPGSCRCPHICVVTCSAWILESHSGHLISCLPPTHICHVAMDQFCPLCGPQFPFLSKTGIELVARKVFSVPIRILSIQGR